MATQAQIDANRQNAQLSTGPTTPEGKAASSKNSNKHGLSGKTILVGDEHRDEAARRWNQWHDHFQPGPAGHYALDVMVAMSLRVEQCQKTLDGLFVAQTTEAKLDWNGLRRREAAILAEGLARRPESVAARLDETRHGAELLLERWEYLAETFDRGEWDESARAIGLDLLGVPRGLREPGRTALDPPDGEGPAAIRAAIDGQVARLKWRLDNVHIATDELARSQAEASQQVLLSKQAKLILRYEREALRRLTSAQVALLNGPRGDAATLHLPPEPSFEGPPVRVGLVPDEEPLPSPPSDPELEELRAIGRNRFEEMIRESKAERGDRGDDEGDDEPEADAPSGPPASDRPRRPGRRRARAGG
jgi:hypothetical protein